MGSHMEREAPEGTKVQARLVVKDCTDPDLISLRDEAPTLSKVGRHLLLQLGVSFKFNFEVEDVTSAFLQEIRQDEVGISS